MHDEINIGNDRDLMDDTEGHGYRGKPAPAAEEADTEGHAKRGPAPITVEDDTEGHGRQGKPAPATLDDEAEA